MTLTAVLHESGLVMLHEASTAACIAAAIRVFRTEKRRNPVTGASYPWIVSSTGVVNQFYVYCVDAGFGPFVLKFSSYFPYYAKLCINGNHRAQRQAVKAGIGFTALDDGFAASGDCHARTKHRHEQDQTAR